MTFLSMFCWWWWLALGALGGWLLSWWLTRGTRRNQPVIERVVEKIVDRPVDRHVDRVVEKLVDNPKHVTRIGELETQVALIAGLRSRIQSLESTPPKIVEKIVEKPVDRVVEKVVERIVDRPVDRVVEKMVEKIVDRPVDRIVEKLVDNPKHLSRIGELETQVALIAGLRSRVQSLESTPPKIVEKVVDRPVDRVVEKVVEKIVDRPVDRIVEKLVDNPKHLSRIGELEAQVAPIAGLRSRIQSLESTPPKIVEKIVDRPVDRIVEKMVDNPVHLTRIRALEDELAKLRAAPRAPAFDRAAAKAAGLNVKGIDDHEIVEGIGPKIAQLLYDDGVNTWEHLSKMKPAAIQAILDKAGPRYALAVPESWPEQAALAAQGRWADLKKFQDILNAGKTK